MQATIRLALAATTLVTASHAAPLWQDSGEAKEAAYTAKLTSLVEAVLDDAAAGTTYECTAECTKKECSAECTADSAPSMSLKKALAFQPSAMEIVMPEAILALEDPDTTQAQSDALLACVLESRSPSLAVFGDKLAKLTPLRLATPDLIAFSEAGSERTLGMLAKQVKAGKGGVPAAALFAFRGDKLGKRALAKAAKAKAVTTDNVIDVLLAGYGLDALGSSDARLTAQLKVHSATLAALDAGDLTTAAALAGTAMKISEVMRHEFRGLSSLPTSLGKAQPKWVKTYATADDIYALIERITPII